MDMFAKVGCEGTVSKEEDGGTKRLPMLTAAEIKLNQEN